MNLTKKRIVSGMRSTGKLHLGHYFGVLTNWVKLQKEYESFFFIADWHALTTKYNDTAGLKESVRDVALDWLACGIDPNKSTIYLQSLVPETAELHIYLSMLTPQNWVERDPTLKDMTKILRTQGDSDGSITYGLLGYPVLMTADIITFNVDYVPVGIDQVAHIEISRDIIRRFNNIYKTEYFKEPKPLLTEIPLLKGIDGNKMGKSFNNDIKISDDEETTQKKIMRCITDRNRMRRDDKGNPENCEVAYTYWKIFGTEDELKEIEEGCKAATLGCADCKRCLAKKINEHFAPIREKRIELAKNPETVRDILIEGSKKARVEARKILDGAKEAIGMYF